VKDINLNEALERGRKLIFKHNLELNPDLYLMLRTVSLLEGIGMSLDPQFRSLDMVKPYAFSLLRQSVNPLKLIRSRSVLAFLADMGQLAYTFPGDVRRILDKLRNDQLRIQTESRSTRMLAEEVRDAGKRVSYAILVAGFLGAAIYLNHTWYSAFLYAGAGIFLLAMFSIRKQKN
jgi:ubiquinone biosynthesis protein